MRIEIDTDNEAFTEDLGAEVMRILRTQVFPALERGQTGTLRLRDINGNTVGVADFGGGEEVTA